MIETLSNLEFTPFFISFKLALITTFILFFIALPLAWWLSQTSSKSKPFFEAVTALPLVLPPSVLGFYILWALSQNSVIGVFFEEYFGIKLVFNFTGLVVASVFYSLPFMVQPLQGGFEALNKNMIEASYISGKSAFTTMLRVALPNIKPSLMTAIIITFAHTVGEFGVVLMVGGSIPNETKVASVAIYEMVEIMDYTTAHVYSAIMVIISFLVLLGVYMFNGKQNRKFGI
ncbi:MAG: molybdenum ABC transporter permease subunit [Sulfurimonas sp. RIFOXYD12_FULL_33_39]|uniref:molybdate ABC transporter permease subunit n=1 Tax=unclassified Sulfurimonas TaxID=2623549 RepID=UPI0008B91A25|nr:MULTISPECIES: molybdate ABC transporter permease subunit [unclassified Sulfurimonas]OHE10199.1 MAG: molybdenum ABC transporter permease subunit [Sulfurimonas sp. RIFOXYD12_FULL_33_39]OHE14580.1 MAG: molybdenum ABC transporter permease subunit [Sulfurimonas sp. RIFOXYD2_FULL_34_21]DAB28281.1 MAG TPA: molybdate ABC transporter permease subunit [Sulfurimonas sp. UBA10385]